MAKRKRSPPGALFRHQLLAVATKRRRRCAGRWATIGDWLWVDVLSFLELGDLLCRVAPSCHRFASLVYDGDLLGRQRTLDLSAVPRQMARRDQHALFGRLPQVDTLIGYAPVTTNATLTMVPDTLTRLHVAGCTLLTDIGLGVVAQHCSLTSVVLDDCPITDRSIRLLALYCKAMQALSVKACKHLTDTAASYMATMTRLTDVNVADCDAITDAGVLQFQRLPRLAALSVAGLRVDHQTVLLVCSRQRPNLRHLDLRDCPTIRNEDARALRVLFPFVTVQYGKGARHRRRSAWWCSGLIPPVALMTIAVLGADYPTLNAITGVAAASYVLAQAIKCIQ
ncbi:Leucine-rich repeat-containing protein [Plasmodiophora brassicae]